MVSDIGISQDAINLAFRIAMKLERLLVERGLEAAAQDGVPNVTADQIKSALDHSLFETLVNSCNEGLIDEARQTERRDSWEAA